MAANIVATPMPPPLTPSSTEHIKRLESVRISKKINQLKGEGEWKNRFFQNQPTEHPEIADGGNSRRLSLSLPPEPLPELLTSKKSYHLTGREILNWSAEKAESKKKSNQIRNQNVTTATTNITDYNQTRKSSVQNLTDFQKFQNYNERLPRSSTFHQQKNRVSILRSTKLKIHNIQLTKLESKEERFLRIRKELILRRICSFIIQM